MRRLCILILALTVLIDTRAFGAKKKRKRKRKKRRSNKTEEVAYQEKKPKEKPEKKPSLSFGVNLGWESLYGNSISMHYKFIDLIGMNFGLGYNTSGAKLGLGSELFIQVSSELYWTSTMAFVYSSGTQGQVSIDASFTPIDTGIAEDLVATKNYELSSGTILSFNTGMLWDLSESMQLITSISYNLVLSGNEIKLSEETTYDKSVEITNQTEFDAALKDKAKEQVEPGGPGVFVGLRFYM